MEKYKEIERSIIKTYRKEIWSKFTKAINDYELIKSNDKIMVCISGGKDSFLLAKCIQELHRHGKIKFEAQYVVMNPGYSEKNIKLIKENAKKLNIPIEIFDSNIFKIVEVANFKSPCYLCARMRRGHLYNKAKELGCNKIALGHHLDDVIETTLLSLFYGAEIKTMMPKLHSNNYPGIELIRPLYMVKERSIISFAKHNEITFLNCACKMTENKIIEEENLNRIWTRFYKVDSSRNREKGGTGIGLSLVKAIMNNYGNKYGVKNVAGGVEFYFELDLKK